MAANMIAESMYAQSDANGNEHLLLKAFMVNRKNSSTLSIENQMKKPLENQQLAEKILANGRTSPHHARSYPILKSCKPIKVAEYALAQGIQHELAFNWWVHHVLKKSD